MYGMTGGMGSNMGGDVAIAGSGQFMNVSGRITNVCDCEAYLYVSIEFHESLRYVRAFCESLARVWRHPPWVRSRQNVNGPKATVLAISAAPLRTLPLRMGGAYTLPAASCAHTGRIALPSWTSDLDSDARTLACKLEWTTSM